MQTPLPLFLLLAVAGLAGCRTSEPLCPRIVNEPKPVTEVERQSFGVMGVLPAARTGEFRFRHPAGVGDSIAKISGDNFDSLTRSIAEDDTLEADDELKLVAFSAAVSGFSGLVGGMLTGVPESDARRAQKQIQAALADNPVEFGVNAQLEEIVKNIRCTNLVVIPAATWAQPPDKSSTHRDFSGLAQSGCDSVVVLEVIDEAFAKRGGRNPPIGVEIRLRVTVVRTSDGHKLYERALLYRGEQYRFVQWGANEAKLFRTELIAAQKTLAHEVCRQLAGDEYFTSKP